MFDHANRKKLRVLQIAPEYPPYSLGGGGLLVMNLSKELINQGNDVTILAGYYPTVSILQKPFATVCVGLNVQWLPLVPSVKAGFQLNTIMPPNLFSAIKLLTFLRRDKFEAVHFHGFGHLICDLAAVFCCFFGLGYILTIHGFPKEPSRRGGLLKVLFSAYSSTIGSFVIKHAYKTVAVSRSLAHECLQYVPETKIDLISNAVDLQSYLDCPFEAIDEVRSKYKLTGKKVLLCIGRLSEAKGFQFVISSLKHVRAAIPEAQVVIIGRDEGYGYLKELRRIAVDENVESAVSFVGSLSDEEKVAFLWLADVVLIPSLEEVFGIVALEALAAGAPIVASDLGGLKEILSDDPYSFLVKSGDVEGIANAALGVLNDKRISAGARDARYSRVKQHSLSQMAIKYTNLYLCLSQKYQFKTNPCNGGLRTERA